MTPALPGLAFALRRPPAPSGRLARACSHERVGVPRWAVRGSGSEPHGVAEPETGPRSRGGKRPPLSPADNTGSCHAPGPVLRVSDSFPHLLIAAVRGRSVLSPYRWRNGGTLGVQEGTLAGVSRKPLPRPQTPCGRPKSRHPSLPPAVGESRPQDPCGEALTPSGLGLCLD